MSSLSVKSNYWRSLDEISETAEFKEFLHREFPEAASEIPRGLSRRRWLQLMGASLALGGIAGCRWQAEKIAPFAVRPEGRTPGVSQRYATAHEVGGIGRSLLVTTFDGRPIKVECNPDHPASAGATDVFDQATILQLYDPDRSRGLVETVAGQQFQRTWTDFEESVGKHFAGPHARGGHEFCVLAEASSSPSRMRLQQELLKKYPKVRWYEYESASRDHEVEGTRLAFGRSLSVDWHFEKARVVLCLDADPLGTHPNSTRHIRDWSAGRAPEDGPMNRLYVVESRFTLTGANADHRFAVRSSDIGPLLLELETRLEQRLQERRPPRNDDRGLRREQFLTAVVDDLIKHRRRSLVAVGAGQPAHVHATAHRINGLLRNAGHTVLYRAHSDERDSHADAIREVTSLARSGAVSTLLILGGNPVYDTPADLQFRAALKQVPYSIHLSHYRDETSRCCRWHLPRTHAFESWGDTRTHDGTVTAIQPLIGPLVGGRTDLELLAMVLGRKSDGKQIVRETVKAELGADEFGNGWKRFLHDGFVKDSAWKMVAIDPAPRSDDPKRSTSNPGLEIVFSPSPSVYDGRFANNGWLQELPDPLTKLTWDNAALIAPETAGRLGVENGTIVELDYRGRTLELPAYVLPGQAADSINVHLGYGRAEAGIVAGSMEQGIPSVGVNANEIRCSDAMSFDVGIKVVSTGRKYDLATTQDHFAIDRAGQEELAGRIGDLVREATLDEYNKHPDFAQHHGHKLATEPLWKERDYDGHAWGMSIDLTKCVGCNACVVACQSENNVPIVGKEQVGRGREMHWLRIDRYFKGEPEQPEVAHQPVACHHCENAPCEQVCPVAATVHSDEGLNDMVYNRCIGTRYCANNCPYKVRRFNFFDYNAQLEEASSELQRMVLNPEVTVRSRGVMEKCTYCVQRIQSAKIDAKNDRRPIQDGEIQTACQQACPANAIEFGDLNQKNSRVAKAHAASRSYGMLAELNTKPRTQYLARIRNPHPALAKAGWGSVDH